MKSRVETAWIMAEIKPYSFEERKTMFTRIKMSAEEEINELRIEGNKRKNVYAARRSKKP